MGETNDPFYPKETLSDFASDATTESVDGDSLSPYTTENAGYE